MVRTRKKRPGPPQEPAVATSVAPKVVTPPPAKEGQVPPIPQKDAGMEAPPVPVGEGAKGAAGPQEIYGSFTGVPSAEGGEVPPVPVVEVTGEGMAPGEPVGPQEPAVSVPDMTPPQEGGYGEYSGPTGTETQAASESPAQPSGGAEQGYQAEPAAPKGFETPAGQESSMGQEAAGPETPDGQTPVFEMEPAATEAPPEEPGQPPEQVPPEGASEDHAGRSAAVLLAQLQRAKTSADGMGEEESAQTPASQLEAAGQPTGGVAPEQPAVVAPSTEIDVQDTMAEGALPPSEDQQAPKPVTRVRCVGCKAAIPVFSAQRPLVVTCPQCGRMGMLK